MSDYKKLLEAGSEANLKNIVKDKFFGSISDVSFDLNNIDFIGKNITFETKYNSKTTPEDMLAQLIATHKRHNEPLKKYIGAFNEYFISFLPSEAVKDQIDNLDITWSEITPSNLTPEVNKKITKILPLGYSFNFSIDSKKIKDYLTKIEKNEPLEQRQIATEEEVKQTIVELNNKLHKIKTIKDTERSLLFGAIMIALSRFTIQSIFTAEISILEQQKQEIDNKQISEQEKDIKKYNAERDSVQRISNSIFDVVEELIESKLNNSSKQKWKDEFVFIRNLELKLSDYKEIIDLIKDKIYESFKVGQKQDVLGKAYKTFLSRAGKIDNKNIIITPDHIKTLMVKLAQLNKDDVVLDTCMGTGGFLMEAMEVMENLPNADKEKIHNSQLVGSEIDTKLFVLACSNMFLHGDGRSLLYDKDTITDDISFEKGVGFFNYIKGLKPTKCIINPPYENTCCFDFTKQALDFLENNGKLVVIIKENTFSKTNAKIEKLLAKNTLEFYIKMPDDLFSEQGRSVSTAIFGWLSGQPHPKDKYVSFYNLVDDGFENIPHNGKIDRGNWHEKEKEVLDVILNGKVISARSKFYKEKIYTEKGELLSIYPKFQESNNEIYQEDFEVAIFDYFVAEQGFGGGGTLAKSLKEIDNRIIKKWIIRELKK
ncbi:MAG: SAM-dependent methyltransferase [Rickettsiales bacterium]|jgi:hypothetical protein|nr:SAM-dependent methyltransferase [Rickettsiales bacterium]